ncbi:MAG: HEAT repeat domain-containing protein [Candidatus Odinarchaeota archaeon]
MEDPKMRKVQELVVNLKNQDLDDETRGQVAGILGEIGGETAVDPLLAVLTSSDSWRLRLACLKSLGKLPGAEKTVPVLERIATNKEERVDLRKWAIDAWIKISKDTTKTIPIAVDPTENETVRTAAIENFDGNENDEAQEKLALLIEKPDEPLKLKWSILTYLSRHGRSPRLIEILDPLTTDDLIEEDLQYAVKNALTKLKSR